MWEARATYDDGTEICEYFDDKSWKSDADMEYELECWLIERDKNCTWYSVNWVGEE